MSALEIEKERAEFLSWWRASKYCQVVAPRAGWEQIALDGWLAAKRSTPAPSAGMVSGGVLPPLPQARRVWEFGNAPQHPIYTAEQMQAYARAAIAAKESK